MEYLINSTQARVLWWTGAVWIAIGLYLGYDPLSVACRAALGACLTTLAVGVLLRLAARVIARRLNDQLREGDADRETVPETTA